tara:strand:+ start:217 stop:417 length:201 start_codon:yes stop_codon:yes gene_type:complete
MNYADKNKLMEDAKQTNNNKLAWAILSVAKGSQLSQVIKITDYQEADKTVALQPDLFYKSGPFYIS